MAGGVNPLAQTLGSVDSNNALRVVAVAGSGVAPSNSKYVVEGTVDANLPNAQFTGALATGLIKNTTTTGVLSIAVVNTDYLVPFSRTKYVPLTGDTITLTRAPVCFGIVAPAGALLALTINMPSSPQDADLVILSYSQAITSLTVAGNGSTIIGAPTSASVVAAQGSQHWYYVLADTTWYRW